MLLQWAERLLEGGGNEQWGDKWEERFKDGKGGKQVKSLPLHRLRSPTLLCTSDPVRQGRLHLACS